ncbi:MAG: peptidylprolyl isomerase [Prolixibacteraceae bacterium]
MNKHLFILILLAIGLTFNACNHTSKQESKKTDKASVQQKKKESIGKYYSSVVDITTYDKNRKLEKGIGFMISPNTIVSTYRLFPHSTKAYIRPWGTNKKIEVTQYLAVDRIRNIILLKVDTLSSPPFVLRKTAPRKNIVTRFMTKKRGKLLVIKKGKYYQVDTVRGNPYYHISNQVHKFQQGVPVLDSNHKVIGIGVQYIVDYQTTYYANPSTFINNLLEQDLTPKDITELNNTPTAEQKRNAKIKKIIISTTMGDIHIRLFNNMPQYRDNFVKLIKEGFYDKLLFHRVIEDFVIQSGAADSRDAAWDDIVGWKGPGYTLPAHINPKYYHKRGMIGSPRMPNDVNTDKRSDGGQFYIVQGRRYADYELDDIQKENNIKFTSSQRRTYKTLGGAPTLDGEYTIFGQVVAGMGIVDKIAKQEVNNEWRPVKNIRIKKISIMY